MHTPQQHAVRLAQCRPHVPQLFRSLDVSTHAPPHSSSPPAQPHIPAMQAIPVGQVVVHEPQCEASLCVFTSHPFAGLPSQSAKPALQLAMWHVPAVHEGVALGVAHTRPQAPQLARFVVRSTQLPPQLVSVLGTHPAEHVYPDPPAVHIADPPVHITPHAPQLVTDERDASQPLAALWSQSAKPLRHTNPQLVPLQVGWAFAGAGQAVHEVPQLATEVSDAQVLPHAWYPALHRNPHEAVEQSAVPFGTPGQA
jgi:hypothetical protein